jgi:formimidoylglutamate deiminase
VAEFQIVEADLTLTPRGWMEEVKVAVDPQGIIAAVGELPDPTTRRLAGRALLPGMVNAHSHAFQRGLRGRGETFPAGAGSFWTWREAMYELVQSLDEEALFRLSVQAFREMRAAGVTTVGEFHYVHHDASEEGYALDQVVLRAAAEAGIRIVLLNTYYRTGGMREKLRGGQLRFRTGSPDEYWKQMDRLAALLDPATQSLGAAVHSLRAASLEEVIALHHEASRRGLVFHMHLEEQPAEIEACVAHYGAPPMALVNGHLKVHDRTVMVHCTHTAPENMTPFLETGGIVCLCPLTEANLGDGLVDVPHILDRRGRICLGTDSNARISMLEEMRLLEYGQRLRSGSRGVLRDERGAVAPFLWNLATLEGARALGVNAGLIEQGRIADFLALDLGHPSLVGWEPETLLTAFVLGAPDDVVAATSVGGVWQDSVFSDRPSPSGPSHVE